MNRKEVIRLAKDAGIITKGLPIGGVKTMEAFAALVAAAEREACAKELTYWKNKAEEWHTLYAKIMR
jgi:hypothetical protein